MYQHTFSKVSAMQNVLWKITVQLTFENFVFARNTSAIILAHILKKKCDAKFTI